MFHCRYTLVCSYQSFCVLLLGEIKKSSSQKEEANTDSSKSDQSMTYGEKFCAFYHAPLVIFSLNSVFHVIFLALFSAAMLAEVPCVNIWWIVLGTWVFAMSVEEVRQISKVGIGEHFCSNKWNFIDLTSLVLFISGTPLRYTDYENTAQIVLAFSMMLFYLRTLHMATFNRTLGPILVMIWEMMVDMSYFIGILMVFVTAYGITLQAIIYPQSTLGWSRIIGAIFKRAFFQIDGEHFLEELDGSMCDDVPTTNNTDSRCPENTAFVPILMEAIYILIASILMLNLLIAKFSYTFQKIQGNVHQVWCSQRYGGVKEYHDRPPMPVPLNVVYHIGQFVVWITNKISIICKGKKDQPNTESESPFHKDYPKYQTSELIMWEYFRAREYVRQTQMDVKHSLETR
ncbi:hypothetical protein NP493_109g03017 [Ridgeia piscesae]|uniref:Ion transport domain-containing protein n=1 Tax=Ridgeia piscesae TaxID=27915 RepID=A0AAD9P702_RIDPI|nr:hypothetical protein NP493_109g03017 [Ridgeia piscesae]